MISKKSLTRGHFITGGIFLCLLRKNRIIDPTKPDQCSLSNRPLEIWMIHHKRFHIMKFSDRIWFNKLDFDTSIPASPTVNTSYLSSLLIYLWLNLFDYWYYCVHIDNSKQMQFEKRSDSKSFRYSSNTIRKWWSDDHARILKGRSFPIGPRRAHGYDGQTTYQCALALLRETGKEPTGILREILINSKIRMQMI